MLLIKNKREGTFQDEDFLWEQLKGGHVESLVPPGALLEVSSTLNKGIIKGVLSISGN